MRWSVWSGATSADISLHAHLNEFFQNMIILHLNILPKILIRVILITTSLYHHYGCRCPGAETDTQPTVTNVLIELGVNVAWIRLCNMHVMGQPVYKQTLQGSMGGYFVIIPPAQRSCSGVYWFHSICPSVCPSVRPSRIPCPLCSTYSSCWIHFIFIHLYQATS